MELSSQGAATYVVGLGNPVKHATTAWRDFYSNGTPTNAKIHNSLPKVLPHMLWVKTPHNGTDGFLLEWNTNQGEMSSVYKPLSNCPKMKRKPSLPSWMPLSVIQERNNNMLCNQKSPQCEGFFYDNQCKIGSVYCTISIMAFFSNNTLGS